MSDPGEVMGATMNKRSDRRQAALLALLSAGLMTQAGVSALAQAAPEGAASAPGAASVPAATAAASAAAAAASSPAPMVVAPSPAASAPKDIALDRPAGASAPAPAAPAGRRAATASPVQDMAASTALAELALELLRGRSDATGDAQANGVVSSLSVASALGLVHAGTSGAGARELAALFGKSSAAGTRMFTTRLPGLLERLGEAGTRSGAFRMANRVWIDNRVAAAVPASYASTVSSRFGADGAVLPLGQSATARQVINAWVSDKTAGRIAELMPEGSITPTTRLVVTNAIHFKSPWAQPFDPAQTAPRPFHVMGGAAKPVPTMADERAVHTGTIDNVTVFELPFAGNEFSLVIGMPPAGHTLDAFEKDLDGIELAGWRSQLKPQTCRFEMPRFTIAPAARPLKPTLQALGVKTVFGPNADLSGMLGKAAKGVYVDNVFHSATIVIDEQGGEAAAATGATMQAKSFSLPAPTCAVNRPFIFAVVHRASGAPLFVGKVADPSKS